MWQLSVGRIGVKAAAPGFERPTRATTPHLSRLVRLDLNAEMAAGTTTAFFSNALLR